MSQCKLVKVAQVRGHRPYFKADPDATETRRVARRLYALRADEEAQNRLLDKYSGSVAVRIWKAAVHLIIDGKL